MPDFVINTGPVIALSVAVGRLDFLDQLYRDIRVPKEVFQELQAGGAQCPEIQMISQVKCMTVAPNEIQVPKYLEAELDLGEGSVIQMAIVQKFPLVVIDEKQGRRIARLHGLRITGSLGILVKAAKQGLIDDLGACFPIATKLRWMGESGGFLKQTADGFQERSGADELADF